MQLTADFKSTPEKRAKTVSDFTDLLTHPGWILLNDIVQEYIEQLKTLVIEGSTAESDMEEESFETIKRIRKEIAAFQTVINTPKTMIENLKPHDGDEEIGDDPYF